MTENCAAVLRLTKGKPLLYCASTYTCTQTHKHTSVKGLRFLYQLLKKNVFVCKCVTDLDLDDMHKKGNACVCVCLFVCYCSLRYLIFNEGREKGERKDHLGLKWLFSQCIPEFRV